MKFQKTSDNSKDLLVSNLLRDDESSCSGSGSGSGSANAFSFRVREESKVANEMSCDMEEQRIMSRNELKEEQIDLLLPELC